MGIKHKNSRPGPRENIQTKKDINISLSEDEISKRAYEIYLERGGLYAPPDADWHKAENELRNAALKKLREENH